MQRCKHRSCRRRSWDGNGSFSRTFGKHALRPVYQIRLLDPAFPLDEPHRVADGMHVLEVLRLKFHFEGLLQFQHQIELLDRVPCLDRLRAHIGRNRRDRNIEQLGGDLFSPRLECHRSSDFSTISIS